MARVTLVSCHVTQINRMPSLFPDSGSGTNSPSLPPFQTLLINGSYHPSAPIHLCLSYVACNPSSRVIFITPSRQSFEVALRDYDDAWLGQNSGSGKIHALSSRTTILCVSAV
jgi:hypothetical protein